MNKTCLGRDSWFADAQVPESEGELLDQLGLAGRAEQCGELANELCLGERPGRASSEEDGFAEPASAAAALPSTGLSSPSGRGSGEYRPIMPIALTA